MNIKNSILNYFRYRIQHYHPEKFWKRRSVVVDINSKVNKLLKWYYLYYIKKCDAYNNASFATYMNAGSQIKGTPFLPHGLNGIVIGDDTIIGKNCTICQQVTIQWGGNCWG